MSRSKRKTPKCSISCIGFDHSEKYNKKKANRRLRYLAKKALRKGDELMPLLREISDIWNFVKDGKQYLGKNAVKTHPDCMRK